MRGFTIHHSPISLAIIPLLVIALGVALSPAGPAHAATTRYVSTTSTGNPGTCTYNGTTYSPCYSTIQAAVNASGSGDFVEVFPGTYNECVTVTQSLVISSFNNYSIDPWSPSRGPEAVIYGGIIVQVTAATPVSIYGLTVQGGITSGCTTTLGAVGADIYASGGTSLIIGYNILQNATNGLVINSSNTPSVFENLIQSNSGAGVMVLNTTNAHIDLNRIRQNGDGILFGVGAAPSMYGSVTDNQITQNTIGVHLPFLTGAYTGNLLLNHNRIFGNTTAGLVNDDTSAFVDATNNWWGCRTGPNSAGCDTVTGVLLGVRDYPYLTMYTYAASAPTSTCPPGSAAVSLTYGSRTPVFADFRCNVANGLTIGAPPGTPVTFTIMPGTPGLVFCETGTTVDVTQTGPISGEADSGYGYAVAHVCANGLTPSPPGTSNNVCAATDNSGQVCTTVVVTGPPSSSTCVYAQGSYSNPGGTHYPGYTANVSYQFFAQETSTGATTSSSYLTFADQRSNPMVTITNGRILSMVQTGPNAATIYGTGTQTTYASGGQTSQTVNFQVTVTGNGTNPNTFRIRTSAGYDSGTTTAPPGAIMVTDSCTA